MDSSNKITHHWFLLILDVIAIKVRVHNLLTSSCFNTSSYSQSYSQVKFVLENKVAMVTVTGKHHGNTRVLIMSQNNQDGYSVDQFRAVSTIDFRKIYVSTNKIIVYIPLYIQGRYV